MSSILERDQQRDREREAEWQKEQARMQLQVQRQAAAGRLGKIDRRLAELEPQAVPLRERRARVERELSELSEPKASAPAWEHDDWRRRRENLRQELLEILEGQSLYAHTGMAKYVQHRGLRNIEADLLELRDERLMLQQRADDAEREWAALA